MLNPIHIVSALLSSENASKPSQILEGRIQPQYRTNDDLVLFCRMPIGLIVAILYLQQSVF